MNKARKKGVVYSGAFHALLLILIMVGLPSILSAPPPEPAPITVEILPISELSNVKPKEAKPKPEEKPKEKEQPKEKPKPAPPVKTAKPEPPPPAEKPDAVKKPVEKEKKPVKKPEEKPKEKEKEKPKEDDLAAILKAVRETAQKEKADKAKEASAQSETAAKSDRYDETMPMSLSEKDAIRNQIAACWNVPAGAKDAQDLIVTLRIRLEADGSVLTVELGQASRARYSSDSFFRAAADSAMRAVRQCSPLKNLPPEKYGTWKDMELTFDPRDMLF